MKPKIDCVLLIDDDKATNFLHHIVLTKSGYVKEIVTRENGKDGLEYLKLASEGKYPKPDLIFLDINMPGMNGWEFLEHYMNFSLKEKADTLIVFLTTSLNPNDKTKSEKIECVDGFISKPLTLEALEILIETHFVKA